MVSSFVSYPPCPNQSCPVKHNFSTSLFLAPQVYAKFTWSLRPSSSSPSIFSLTLSATSSLRNRTKTSVTLSPPWTSSSVRISWICPCCAMSVRRLLSNASSLQGETRAMASVGVSFFLFLAKGLSPPAGRQFSMKGSGGLSAVLALGFLVFFGYWRLAYTP